MPGRSTSRPLGVALVALATLAGCEGPPPAPQAKARPAPVLVARAAVRTVPVELRAIGTVRVFASVAVRPRVGGEILAVHFAEGADVKKDQTLFTIDRRPYEATLAQAEAQLDKDLALLRGAEANLDRAEPLAKQSVISSEEVENRRTEVASQAATVAADRAAIRSARLQLDYTEIKSPIDGRTGSLLITPGNVVTPDQAPALVVINQLAPIAVVFSVSERNLSALRERLAASAGELPLTADLRDGTAPLAGTLTFINNEVDVATGMVQLKATFENADRRLWPGQFVDVVLKLSERPGSVTVPTVAVREGQQGQYVFVVTPEKTAKLVPVTTAFATPDGQSVIAEGLAGGETVVTEGHLRVLPGGPVAPPSEEKPTS